MDVSLKPPTKLMVTADASKLQQGLVGAWGLNGDAKSASERKELKGQIVGGAQFVDSPIGKKGKAISLDGNDDAVVIPRNYLGWVSRGFFSNVRASTPKRRAANHFSAAILSWC